MKKLIYIENLMDAKSSKIAHAIEIAGAKGFELSALFVIPVHPDVADWIEIQEKQTREAEAKVKKYAEALETQLNDQGESFTWKVVQSMPDAFMQSIQALTPVDVIMAGNIDLDKIWFGLAHNLGNPGETLNCVCEDGGDEGHPQGLKLSLGFLQNPHLCLCAWIGQPKGIDETVTPVQQCRIRMTGAGPRSAGLGSHPASPGVRSTHQQFGACAPYS